MLTVRDRLNAFMKRRNITRNQLADALSTPVKTMDGWRYSGTTPPAVMLSVLDLIEGDSHVRARLGLSRRKKLPRGRPFPPGNRYRIGSPTRKAALIEARQRKKAAVCKKVQ